jgi:hypothetical protein
MTTLSFDPARLYRSVWRTTLDHPGWGMVLIPDPPGGVHIRREMLRVLAALSDEAVRAGAPPFVVERLGRFDQQVTTKFHRDGAPHASLLILGYEPTTVRSRLLVADAYRAAADEGIGVNAFLSANNPMLPPGEAKLTRNAPQLTWPPELGVIIVVNNNLFPDDTPPGYPLGLLHKGVIETPDPAARRVINSLGATPDGVGVQAVSVVSEAEVERFVSREELD